MMLEIEWSSRAKRWTSRCVIFSLTYIKEFGLLSTTFVSWDGKLIHTPNIELSKVAIHNVRRSGPQAEELELSVELDTPQASLDRLEEFFLAWVAEHEARELQPRVWILTREIYDVTRMDISVVFFHKSNWSDGRARFARRTRVMMTIREGLLACGIILAEKPIRVLES
jgi:small-conductance mechanosensitive channel